MKVALVITRMVRGGSARMALETARRTREAGHEVVFASGRDNTGANSFWDELNRTSLTVRELNWLKRAPGYWDFPAVLELLSFFRTAEPDCVHLHTSKAGTLGAVAARVAGVPGVVYSSHGHLFHSKLELQDVNLRGMNWYIYFWLRRLTIALSDRVVALSEQDYAEQRELKLGDGRDFVVIPNGVDFEAFRSTSSDPTVPELPDNSESREFPVLLHVGRLVREKGQDTLIRAVDRLRADYPDMRCLVVGEGPHRDRLEALIEKLGLEETVVLTGSRDDVVPYYRVADVFCFPSQYESQGLAVMEAMAAGLPVVATREGGLSELVEHERTSLAVDPKSDEQLADAVNRLLSEPQLARRLAETAENLIEEGYSLEAHADRMVDLYETVVGVRR